MTVATRRFSFGLLALLVVAACGGSPTGSGAATPAVTGAPGTVVPDQTLEDLFPDTIGGSPLNVDSATGQSVFLQFGQQDPAEFNQFLADVGATIDQVSVALGLLFIPPATEGEQTTGVSMVAFRVRGVQAATTLAKLIPTVQADVENAQIAPATIAGKPVTSITDPDDPESSVYLYAHEDIVFMVGGTPNLVEEAFSKLP